VSNRVIASSRELTKISKALLTALITTADFATSFNEIENLFVSLSASSILLPALSASLDTLSRLLPSTLSKLASALSAELAVSSKPLLASPAFLETSSIDLASISSMLASALSADCAVSSKLLPASLAFLDTSSIDFPSISSISRSTCSALLDKPVNSFINFLAS
jgi:hypothetical protein